MEPPPSPLDSPDLAELYQAVILDHSRRPRNFGVLAAPTAAASGDNPSCGDQLTVQLRVDPAEGRIEEVAFTGEGCSICLASASLMTTKVKRRTRAEAALLCRQFHEMIGGGDGRGPGAAPAATAPALGDLRLLGGVRRFPSRVKCATLAWHALAQALAAPAPAN